MRFHQLFRTLIYGSIFALLLSSCAPPEKAVANNGHPALQPVNTPEAVQSPAAVEEEESENSDSLVEVPFSTADLEVISAENIQGITQVDVFYPYFPPYVAVSGNQRVMALGDLSGVKVVENNTDEIVMHISAELPICQYGFGNYLHFDHTGSFLAVATLSGVEIWQVGGGKVYSAPYLHGQELDMLTCGLDVPQLALSPQGKYLAESGLFISPKGYSDYFRIIDVIKNEVVYQWDGNPDTLHGQLNSHQGLGFSADGQVLQTFLPEAIEVGLDRFYPAFHFWSAESFKPIDITAELYQSSLIPGSNLFAASKEVGISIIKRDSGRLVSRIPLDGCLWDDPCKAVFSPDGKKMAVLVNSEDIVYKRTSFISKILVFDVETGNLENEHSVLLYEKQSVVLKNDGQLDSPGMIANNPSGWWTHVDYFSGFRENKNSIMFTPQVYDLLKIGPMYAGTCAIDRVSHDMACQNGVMFENDAIINIEFLDQGFALLQVGGTIAQIKYPPGSDSDQWQVRLKAYSDDLKIGYFCLDRTYREETCVIMDFAANEILQEQVDLYGFIRSQEMAVSAFINREDKRLILFDENSGKSETLVPYEAVAYPVKPAIFANGKELLYLVKSLKTGGIYIDQVSLEGGKVIKRYQFEDLEDLVPTAISVHPQGEIWAVGDETGKIVFFDAASEEKVFQLTVSSFGIIDLHFSSGGKQLFVIDKTGKITSWAVK